MKQIILCAILTLTLVGNVMAATTIDTASTSIAQQSQGQQQSTASGVQNSGNSGVTFKDSFNGAAPIRYLPLASGITYSGMAPQMFSNPQQDKGANFLGANNVIGIMGAWKVKELADPDFEVDDVDIDITNVGTSLLSEEDREAIDIINFSIQGSETQLVWKDNRTVLAMGTMQADNKKINSVELFMTLAVKAKTIGATAVVIMSEGVKITLKSFGWGIGFSYNIASVDSKPNGTGSAGAGGTGISGGSAGYTRMPYLTFSFLQ